MEFANLTEGISRHIHDIAKRLDRDITGSPNGESLLQLGTSFLITGGVLLAFPGPAMAIGAAEIVTAIGFSMSARRDELIISRLRQLWRFFANKAKREINILSHYDYAHTAHLLIIHLACRYVIQSKAAPELIVGIQEIYKKSGLIGRNSFEERVRQLPLIKTVIGVGDEVDADYFANAFDVDEYIDLLINDSMKGYKRFFPEHESFFDEYVAQHKGDLLQKVKSTYQLCIRALMVMQKPKAGTDTFRDYYAIISDGSLQGFLASRFDDAQTDRDIKHEDLKEYIGSLLPKGHSLTPRAPNDSKTDKFIGLEPRHPCANLAQDPLVYIDSIQNIFIKQIEKQLRDMSNNTEHQLNIFLEEKYLNSDQNSIWACVVFSKINRQIEVFIGALNRINPRFGNYYSQLQQEMEPIQSYLGDLKILNARVDALSQKAGLRDMIGLAYGETDKILESGLKKDASDPVMRLSAALQSIAEYAAEISIAAQKEFLEIMPGEKSGIE